MNKLNGEKDVTARLGIGRSSFYELIRTGQLRSVRIGRSIRVSDAEIDRFISEGETVGVERGVK